LAQAPKDLLLSESVSLLGDSAGMHPVLPFAFGVRRSIPDRQTKSSDSVPSRRVSQHSGDFFPIHKSCNKANPATIEESQAQI
jgi:hypothetical protein